MSQPVVAAVLGVVVLGETLDAGRAGMIALVAAVLVMTAAIIKLARVEAVSTRDRVEAQLHEEVGLAGVIGPLRALDLAPNDEFIAVATPIGCPGSHWHGSAGKSH